MPNIYFNVERGVSPCNSVILHIQKDVVILVYVRSKITQLLRARCAMPDALQVSAARGTTKTSGQPPWRKVEQNNLPNTTAAGSPPPRSAFCLSDGMQRRQDRRLLIATRCTRLRHRHIIIIISSSTAGHQHGRLMSTGMSMSINPREVRPG